MTNCIFCRIIKNEIPSNKIYENENFIVILDINPVNEGHCLVIPKAHYKLVSEMPDSLTKEILGIAKKISIMLRKSEINCEDINFIISDGEKAGQEVPHIHLHIIPRFSEDGFGFKRFGKKQSPSSDELNKTLEKIKNG